jgi:hypothetical protein
MRKIAILAVIGLLGCTTAKSQKSAPVTEHVVQISTDLGDMKVKLYNQTPLSRDNFIKLVNEGFYDSLLFHRVMKEFMIQGGDPQSKKRRRRCSIGHGQCRLYNSG